MMWDLSHPHIMTSGVLSSTNLCRTCKFFFSTSEMFGTLGAALLCQMDGHILQSSNKTMLNLLVSTLDGTVFLKSIDATCHIKSGILLAHLLGDVVEEVGVENIVQLITNNAATYVLVEKKLEDRFPTFVWTPCATHFLELLLEDIGRLP